MIDSHAHLYWPDYEKDFDQVIKRAVDAGLTHIIDIGVDLKTSQKALKQAKEITKLQVYSTIGLHPHDAADSLPLSSNVSIQTITNQLENLFRRSPKNIVAVGECGLDYYAPTTPLPEPAKTQQEMLFKAQVGLAKKLNLPLVIHCRDAWNEIFDFLDNSLTGVFHCWSGSYQDAKQALALGFYISFAGNITYPKAHNLRQVAQLIPLDKILIETDSPFLSPEGKRGQRNEPANVLEVAETIAQTRSISRNQVIETTSNNTIHLFNL